MGKAACGGSGEWGSECVGVAFCGGAVCGGCGPRFIGVAQWSKKSSGLTFFTDYG